VMETSMMYAVFMVVILIGIVTNELFNLVTKEEKNG